ncbi:TIGR04282 family arsenosugar biosynthesis glycosyltransferase [candidate division KSB1 bacterium]|nr:TIGR04282 family arsenosugar biosynthesis glycosyltransferase [candidate division KSB1 bacterium]
MAAQQDLDQAAPAQQSNCALVCLARLPEFGKCKKRLAKEAGESEAFRIYSLLVSKLKDLIATLPAGIKVQVRLTEPCSSDEFHKTFGQRPNCSVQCSGDLGSRMLEGAGAAFASGATKVVIVGSDVPGLTSEIIERAFFELNRFPLVIGPAQDGGYYLLGMREVRTELFADIPWGSPEVLERTQLAARSIGLPYSELEVLRDVDTLADWEAVKNTL